MNSLINSWAVSTPTVSNFGFFFKSKIQLGNPPIYLMIIAMHMAKYSYKSLNIFRYE